MSFIIIIITSFFLILTCLLPNIYTKPINGDKNDNKNNESNSNITLHIFIVIVILFILGSLLYFTKSLWVDCIKTPYEKLLKHRKKESTEPDEESTDKVFENIVFDSFHFSEVAGNSNLSIDITNIMEKYIGKSKDESSILDINSLSQNNITKPDISKSFTCINNTKQSPTIESYNEFEDELNNLKTQEITDSKISGGDTSYIENSSSFIREGNSIDPTKKILVGINNIEVINTIDAKSFEKDENKSIKDKCSQKSENSKSSEDESEENLIENSAININDEKTLINKSKPLDDEESIEESSVEEDDSENKPELSNDNNEALSSTKSSKENSISEEKVETNQEEIDSLNETNSTNETDEDENDSMSEIDEEDDLIDSLNETDIDTDIEIHVDAPSSEAPEPNSITVEESVIVHKTPSLKSSKPEKFNANLVTSFMEEHSDSSSDEESIRNIGAKIDPITTNDDSISSLDLGEVNTSLDNDDSNFIMEEEIINDHTNANDESLLEAIDTNSISEEKEPNKSYAIIKDGPPKIIIETVEDNDDNNNSPEIMDENDNIITPETVDENDDHISPETGLGEKSEKIFNEQVQEKVEPIIETPTASQTETGVEEMVTEENLEDKRCQMTKIEEKLQEIQESLEHDITDVKPPLAGEELPKSPFKLNKRTSSLNLRIKKRRESIGSKESDPSLSSKKKNKSQKSKKVQDSIDEEIQSLANEMDNDMIKEKFNDYVERRNSIQSNGSGSSSNSKRMSALSAYILQNENLTSTESDITIPIKGNTPTSSSSSIITPPNSLKSTTTITTITNNPSISSKLSLSVDTSVDESYPSKEEEEDHTLDRPSPVTPSSSTISPSHLHDQLRSPTPPGFIYTYGHSISPTPSGTSSTESLRDCISPTPSEESTVSSSSYSYSIGKVSRNKQFEVVYDHKPQLPDEIPLKKGDKVKIKQVFEDGWAYGIVTNNKNKHMDGIFPIQCLGEEIEPARNGRRVPRLIRVYQARLEDGEQARQEEEEFKKKITDQARKNILLKLALSHPK